MKINRQNINAFLQGFILGRMHNGDNLEPDSLRVRDIFYPIPHLCIITIDAPEPDKFLNTVLYKEFQAYWLRVKNAYSCNDCSILTDSNNNIYIVLTF